MAISVGIRNFPTPVYFVPPLKEFRLKLGIGAGGSKKLEWWGYRAEQQFDDIFSHVDTMHQRDRRSDRRT